MNFDHSEEQNLLRDSVQRWVREHYDFERRRRQLREHQGFDPAQWRQMAELGWLAVPFAEADGGLGGSIIDIAVVMEEFGKGLVVEPYLANVVLAGGVLRRAADEAQRAAWLPGLIDGSTHWALAFAERHGRYDLSCQSLQAVADGDGWRLDGEKIAVLNGDTAARLIVSARLPDGGMGLFVLDADAAGVNRTAWRTIDGFRAAEVVLRGVRVGADARLGAGADARALLETVLDEACVALCAEAVGIMENLYRKTVEYTKQRKQFGVPIASFQVLQHRMVDMFIQHEQAKSLLLMACIKLRDQEGSGAARKAASALKAYCGKAGRLVGQQGVQLHGGMGMTDEFFVGHAFKRLTAVDALFGNEDFHLQRFAALA
jgi:alkylation response protein AidB-like acyl-CoA dehydrogenase